MAPTPDDPANEQRAAPVTPPTDPAEASAPTGDGDRSVTELVFDLGERVSILVREEIQLAKAEVTEKLTKLGRGAGVGVAAGVFGIAALIMLLHGLAWLINDIFGFTDAVWLGFMIEAALWIIVAAVAGLLAKKLLEDSSPPVPEMAIEEAKQTKETLGGNR